MRLSLLVLSAVFLVGPASFAKGGGKNKKFVAECRQENPGASKKQLKKCVKAKATEAKTAH